MFIQRGLFGGYVVCREWGRIGQPETAREDSATTLDRAGKGDAHPQGCGQGPPQLHSLDRPRSDRKAKGPGREWHEEWQGAYPQRAVDNSSQRAHPAWFPNRPNPATGEPPSWSARDPKSCAGTSPITSGRKPVAIIPNPLDRQERRPIQSASP
ncbi:hypothetical protein [Thioalkalivibrio sp. ALMg13-2]|uniref:hypothetical protein n=1 Tax=Thioalkalivibrio sp. ALMg13-2 TaxID=1158167 RepID=UPI001E646F80|nr:hypothetical protein [Thioalkalivibrio sp. ALMg13-2]